MSKYIKLEEATDLFRGIDADMTGEWVADTLESLPTIEPCEDAVRVYEYLKEKLGDEIVSDQKEFEAWFERVRWHVKRCDELGRMVCEDAISREDAIRSILGLTMYKGAIPMDSAIFQIKSLPSVAPSIDIVRCKECKWYDPPHIEHKNGTRTDVEEDAPMVSMDVGINVGGKCIPHIDLKTYCTNHDRENPDDYEEIVIFRNPDDFCSYGERKESE